MLMKIGAFITAVVFLFVSLSCISADGLQIQTALRGAVTSGLQSNGITGVQVQADGRDITLRGKVATEAIKAKAGDLAAGLSGVRSVDNELVVTGDVQAIQTKLNSLLLDKKIDFENGSSTLLPSSTPVLEEVLAVLNQAPQLSVNIHGYTDNMGDASANRLLSQARAEAVVDWLEQHGIAQERMKAQGHGPDKPIAPNDTPEGRARNRRVEIIVNS